MAYTFDANGNRQSASYTDFAGSGNTESLSRTFTLDPGHNKVLAVNESYGLTTGAPTASTQTLQWDASGKLLQVGSRSFTYDPRGILESATTPTSGTTRYLTNTMAQRVRKITSDNQATDMGRKRSPQGSRASPWGITSQW